MRFAPPPVVAVVAALAVLGGCGPDGGGASPAEPGPPVRPTPAAELSITVRDGRRGSAEATLRCSPGADRVTGYLRLSNAPELCRGLREQAKILTGSPPRERVCAEVYGGPATARFEGRIDGRRVDRRLTRADACEIADWDALDPLLPDVD